MYAKAVSKYLRISPQKAQVIAGLLRGKTVAEAMAQITVSGTKAGRLMHKTLSSAVANASHLHDADESTLKVLEVRIDEGPRLKRSKPKNRGGSHPILKRMSHFTVVVGVA